jgi:hypothetical protein
MDQIVLYITFHPTAAEGMFFSSTHGQFPSVGPPWAHKKSLSKFIKIAIILSMFLDHSGGQTRHQ